MRTLNCVGRMSTTTRQAVLMTFLWMLLLMTTVSVGLASFPAAPSEVNTCDISEFRCPSKDGQGTLCLPMDRWCNGKDDCDNRVDEPRSCSICNRTYYARLGSTYRLSLVRPRLTGTTQILPWHCWFNFTALGGHHGDRVLVGMEAFSVGQLHRSENGSLCLGGQVVQRDAQSSPVDVDVVHGGDQIITGAWCGEGWGQPITTSAGKWLQLMLTISDVVDLSRFRFDLTYRVVRSDVGNLSPSASAVAQLSTNGNGSHNGASTASTILWYGDPVPGTLCSRNLHSCDQRTCILQSPNFPGLYPRNVTCYYYIRQAWSPKNQTILLTLVQTEPGQSFSVRTSDAGDKERKMLSGRDCRPHVDDTLSIYNGATIESPLLARLCGTGDMPAITGAGGELLVVFRSQPHDAPFNPAPLGASPGFRLMTRVRFVPSSQVRHYHPECRLSLASSGSNSRRSQRQGIIRSPEVTLAPNSTCLYDFTGREDQRVWITFLSYRLEGVLDDADCLTLTDGQEVVSRQCGNAVQPRICPHALVHANASTAYKPCRWQDGESYLSRTPRFAIRQDLATGTTLRPWSFVIRFEFVTVDRFSSLMGGGGGGGGGDGRPDAESASAEATPISAGDDDQSVTEMTTPDCFQLLESRNGNGSVSSPRNPMLYGRGGSRHLRCLYRFQAGRGEHTHLTINPFHSTGCARFNQSGCQACLSVDEVFWGGRVRRRSYQTCRSLSGNNPVVLQSAASSLELVFEVRDMNWAQDDDHFYFVAEYSFSSGIDPTCWDTHQQSGKRGTMRIDPRDRCVRHSIPWHIQAPRGGYIILVFPAGQAAVTKNVEECLTNNRLFVYSISDSKTSLYREICLGVLGPIDDKSQPLHLYSAGWYERNWMSDGLLVVASLQGIQSGVELPMTVTWLAVYKDVANTKSASFAAARQAFSNASQMICRTGCAPLNACLSADLWCDDRDDCPDGSDEQQCIRLVFWPLYVGLVVIVVSLTSSLVAVYLIHRFYQTRRYSVGRKYKSRPANDNKKAKFSSVTVSLSRHYEKAGPGS